MKTAFTIIVLFFISTVLLLALVDLEPYLGTPEKMVTMNAQSGSEPIPVKEPTATPSTISPTTTPPPSTGTLVKQEITTESSPAEVVAPEPSPAPQAERADTLPVATAAPADDKLPSPVPVAPLPPPADNEILLTSAADNEPVKANTVSTDQPDLTPLPAQPVAVQQLPSPPEPTPAAAPEPEAEIGTVVDLPDGDYPFTVLLDTYSEKERAVEGVQLYQAQGITSHWVRVNLGSKGIWYRLFSGFFQNQADGNAYLAAHNMTEKVLKMARFSSLIGKYKDKSSLAGDIALVEQGGAMPVVIGTKNGELILFVGAFYTRQGAEDQCAALVSTGLKCRPVERSTRL